MFRGYGADHAPRPLEGRNGGIVASDKGVDGTPQLRDAGKAGPAQRNRRQALRSSDVLYCRTSVVESHDGKDFSVSTTSCS